MRQSTVRDATSRHGPPGLPRQARNLGKSRINRDAGTTLHSGGCLKIVTAACRYTGMLRFPPSTPFTPWVGQLRRIGPAPLSRLAQGSVGSGDHPGRSTATCRFCQLTNVRPRRAWNSWPTAGLRESPYYFLKQIRCHFEAGVLTLRGTVPLWQLRQFAESIVARVEGVRKIENEVERFRSAARTYRRSSGA